MTEEEMNGRIIYDSLESSVGTSCDHTYTQKADRKQIGGDHYMNMGLQPWKAMKAWMSEEEFKGFLRGNVIKYVARCWDKNGVEDLNKAMHYLEKLIEESEKNET
jgi:hypothetical protein